MPGPVAADTATGTTVAQDVDRHGAPVTGAPGGAGAATAASTIAAQATASQGSPVQAAASAAATAASRRTAPADTRNPQAADPATPAVPAGEGTAATPAVPANAASGAHTGAGTDGRASDGTGSAGAMAGTTTPASGTATAQAPAAGFAEALAATGATPATSSPSDAAAVAAPVLTAPTAADAADRVVAEALGRIRATVRGGVPGLESTIEDPRFGTIRILVAARPGETVKAELVAANPAAAGDLHDALSRAIAAGQVLPAGVELRVRPEAVTRLAGMDGDTGRAFGDQRGAAPDTHQQHQHQPATDRRGDEMPAFAFGREGAGGRPDDSAPRGRERRPGPITATGPVTTSAAARSGSALDVRA